MVSLHSFDLEFLNLSWNWLHDPEIKTMTMAPDFSKEEQMAWFQSIPARPHQFIWGVRTNGIPIGACGLKIDGSIAEYWGYIGEKLYWGNGLGGEILALAEAKAWGMGIKEIWLKVGQANERAIHLYQKSGYRILDGSQRDSCLKFFKTRSAI